MMGHLEPRRIAAPLVAGLFVLVGCGGSDDASPFLNDDVSTESTTDTDADADAASTDPQSENRWVAPSGAYSVVFPDGAEPEVFTQPVPVPGEEELNVDVFIVETASSAVTASQLDYGSLTDDIELDLQGAVDGAIAAVEGELTSSTPRTIQGRDAIEYEFTFIGGRGRAIVVDERSDLIQLQDLALGDREPGSFVDTLQFTGEAG